MAYRIAGLLLLALVLVPGSSLTAAEKPRVIVLTDIENEPDDAQSMVRFLVYSNQWDVEALIATTSIHQKDKVAAWRIREIVQAYGKVRDNLEQHEQGFPTADDLLSVIREGRAAYGMTAVGQGMDSPGSERIIEVVDREDPRPVWVIVWGGPNCLAQALWKVRATRSMEALDRFVAKLRVYTISDQDDSGPWLRKQFPKLFYITSPGFSAGGAYHHATWSGISGDYFHGRFAGADFSLVTDEWLDRNIRRKGPLGAEYPEPGTLAASSARDGQPVPIHGFDQPRAWFTVPTQRVMPPGTGTMHIILAVTDHGTPRLTRYRRVIVTVQAAASSAAATAVPARQIAWSSEVLHQALEWYASADARAIADSVIQYQSPQGGWPKSTDLGIPPRSPEDVPQPGDGRANTIDNGATTTPMRFLARVADATGEAKYRKAFERGMDYLFAAQYPNGGWPQFYPLREGYYSRIRSMTTR